MNKREIILDFTSLLDVIMIILFFFILFSHIETADAKLALQTAQERADSLSAEAEQKIEEANDILAELAEKERSAEEKLREADLAGERQGQNVSGIMDFSKNINIRIVLNVEQENDSWDLGIYRGDEFVSQIDGISDPEKMADVFSSVISDMGYTSDSTLLCVFVYDGGKSGTRRPFLAAEKMFEELQKQYEHFFYSKINLNQLK